MGHETILVVEDDPDIAYLMVATLSDEGYAAEQAANGAEGYARARILHPALMLLDIMMPGMDGFALYSLLQADETTRGIPAIFVSAKCTTSDRVRTLLAGMTVVDFLAKPFDTAELVARVDVALHHHAHMREAKG